MGKKTPNCPFPLDFVTLLQQDRSTAIGNMVTGQLADTPTRGLLTRGLVSSRTGQLADDAAKSSN